MPSLSVLARAIQAPDDYQQGATVKIMFLHVPAAWLGMMGWGLMSVAALGTLVWRHPLADVAGKAAAPIGAAFTLICLITGSLWGRPTWGTYWVWDARLTSELVLFLLYLGVLALYWTAEDPGRGARAAADPDAGRRGQSADHQVLGRLVELAASGRIDLPRRRLDHRRRRSCGRWSIMALAFTLLFFALHLAAMRNEILRRRVRTMQILRAQAHGIAA